MMIYATFQKPCLSTALKRELRDKELGVFFSPAASAELDWLSHYSLVPSWNSIV